MLFHLLQMQKIVVYLPHEKKGNINLYSQSPDNIRGSHVRNTWQTRHQRKTI